MTDPIHIQSSSPGQRHVEKRHVVIYGYTRQELAKILRHFESQLPDFVKITVDNTNLVTRVTLSGVHTGVELLRFNMNRYQQTLKDIFPKEVVTTEDKQLPEVLGQLLSERELTVASAESCTGGNIAHRITQVAGSSAYFLGSVVSYSNDVKAGVLGVSRNDIRRDGAVSRPVVEQMATGVSRLMHSDCAIATSGIAGPDGGTRFKPVGTVWIAVKYADRVVSEIQHFKGSRNQVIESATDHGIMMLINMLRDCYEIQEDINDE